MKPYLKAERGIVATVLFIVLGLNVPRGAVSPGYIILMRPGFKT